MKQSTDEIPMCAPRRPIKCHQIKWIVLTEHRIHYYHSDNFICSPKNWFRLPWISSNLSWLNYTLICHDDGMPCISCAHTHTYLAKADGMNALRHKVLFNFVPTKSACELCHWEFNATRWTVPVDCFILSFQLSLILRRSCSFLTGKSCYIREAVYTSCMYQRSYESM